MPTLDHHIVPCRDQHAAACWLTDILGLPAPRCDGPFQVVDLGPSALLFAGWDHDVAVQHYAFAVTRDELDMIVARLVAGGMQFWADHDLTGAGSVRHDEQGSGIYFRSPDGHLLELLTRD